VQEIDVGSDHFMVVCQLQRREGVVTAVLRGLRKWKVGQVVGGDGDRPSLGARAKLRRLDVALDPYRVREYVACLGEGLRSEAGDWKKTEQVMTQAAIKTLPELPDPTEESWLTVEANRELRQLYHAQSGLCRMLRCNTGLGEEAQRKVMLDRNTVRKAIRRCVRKHKDLFRRRLAEAVVKGVDQLKVQAAFNSLTKGYD
jgi:hypothetical protein